MTDNDIIKALGSCPYQRDCVSCDIDSCNNSPNYIMKCARDLINRQKAEVERLQAEIDKVNHDYILLCSDVAENRAEAIKEFAERLKKDLCYEDFFETNVVFLDESKIDNLVKEMVGDLDG